MLSFRTIRVFFAGELIFTWVIGKEKKINKKAFVLGHRSVEEFSFIFHSHMNFKARDILHFFN